VSAAASRGGRERPKTALLPPILGLAAAGALFLGLDPVAITEKARASDTDGMERLGLRALGLSPYEYRAAWALARAAQRRGDPPLADALTVNAYLGGDSVEPFLGACRRHGAGIFCLVRTSNAGAADVQDVSLSDGRTLWQHVAGLVREWGTDLVGERGLSSVGAVVGATYPRAVAEARRLMPQAVLLLPGVGAQGASAADVARAFTSGPASALVAAHTSARSARPDRSRHSVRRATRCRNRRRAECRAGSSPITCAARKARMPPRDQARPADFPISSLRSGRAAISR